MTGRRIPIPLPNTGALARKRNSFYLRAVLIICVVLFVFLQLHIINYREYLSFASKPSTHFGLVTYLSFKIFSCKFCSPADDYRENSINEIANDSTAAILSMVPPVYRKYLTAKNRSHAASASGNGSNNNSTTQNGQPVQNQQPSIDEMQRNIARYNELQSVLNEDLFGPLQNDSVIIVIQVSQTLHTHISFRHFRETDTLSRLKIRKTDF